jgi:hypothetical protein
MFGIVGRIVIYGFCLYGMRRMFEKLHISDADENSSVKLQQNEQPLGKERSTSVTALPAARTDWPRGVSPIA